MGRDHILGLVCHLHGILNPPFQHHNTLDLLYRPHSTLTLHCPHHSIRDPHCHRHSIPNRASLPHNILGKPCRPHNTQNLFSCPLSITQDPHFPPHSTQNKHSRPHSTHHWSLSQYLPCLHTITPNSNNSSYIVTLHPKTTPSGALTTSLPASCPSLRPLGYTWCPQPHLWDISSSSSRGRC